MEVVLERADRANVGSHGFVYRSGHLPGEILRVTRTKLLRESDQSARHDFLSLRLVNAFRNDVFLGRLKDAPSGLPLLLRARGG